MRSSEVPVCFRGSLIEARVFEDGERAGKCGLGADVNPWREVGSLVAMGGVHPHSGTPHAVRFGIVPFCGAGELQLLRQPFIPTWGLACQRCVRAVEAQRKRLEKSWEQGRLSSHPK